MSWRRWKRGLVIATLTGGCAGGISLAVGVTWQQAAILIGVAIAREVQRFLSAHPIETLTDTTSFKRKE